jgi:hypothetical protein
MYMTSTIFWDIKPCSPLKVNRRFEEHRSGKLAACFHADILHGFFDLEDGEDMFLRNVS